MPNKRQQTKVKLKVVMLKLLLKRKPKNLKTKNLPSWIDELRFGN
jgi:hypothetical protein